MKLLGDAWKWLITLPPKQIFLLIFFAAFALRVVGVLATHQYLDVQRYELERTAISLAQKGVYGNPYSVPTGPSAHVSPGYTLILAVVFKLFGTGISAELIKQFFASAISSLQCALIVPAARGLLLNERVGLVSAIFAALLPAKFGTETMGDWEAPYTAIALMTVSVLMVRLYATKDFSTRHAALAGFAWGVSILFAAILLPIFVSSVLLGLVFAWRGKRLTYLRFCLIDGLIAAACLAPWVTRNDRVLGAPVLTRTNPGLELRVSNNDIAAADEHVNYEKGVYHAYHPLQNRGEALKLRQIGEIAYNRQAEQQALGWIQTHPGKFLQLTIKRVGLFWFYMPPTAGAFMRTKYFVLALIHLIGLLGLIHLFTRHRTTAIVLSTILLVYPIPNYLIHVGPRQTYPIDWILNLLMFSLTFASAPKIFSALPEREQSGSVFIPR
jgi:hypothetical protein